MFERFDRVVKDVVVGSQAIAVEQGSEHVDAVHLACALLRRPVGVVHRVLEENGVAADAVEAEFDKVRRRGGLSDTEVDALAAVGIDVDHVLAQLGGQDDVTGRRRRKFFHHMPFSDAARRVLLRSLEEARNLGEKRITVDHVLLGALGVQGPVADVLADAGVTPTAVRRHLQRL
ncbi:Clp protease N-terminal domain-containing protein [Saccharomonospora azurea]|uniref:Clp protease N-terminal domain-containing protein n=1 Tax=Saccharomonospora azurea TaxID=40988 RepID=UPI00240A8D1F|nr:Clp protease N-terminal domain-containing protein [Saccharomonospora azurea]